MKRILLFSLFIFSAVTLYLGFNAFSQSENPQTDLKKNILRSLSGAKGKYSVVVTDLKNQKTESVYGDKVYKIGSLYKLWVMVEVFSQIQKGEFSYDEVLSEDVKVLNKDFNIDAESAELTEGTITLTVKEALKQMITISHNYSALLLTKRIGLSNVVKFLQGNGLRNSYVGGNGSVPTSTADDITAFFEKLYRGEFANAKYTNEMLDLLKAQKLNDKLPKLLPKEIAVAHKTGEMDYLTHDGGIVFTKNGDYVIVVLSESNYPSGAKERIAQISKAVFDYFSSLGSGGRNSSPPLSAGD